MKIGLSLPLCIQDIVRAKIAICDVAVIITDTTFKNDAEWEKFLSLYKRNHWISYQKEAVMIANYFRDNGKIYQPQLHGESALSTSHGHWAEIVRL